VASTSAEVSGRCADSVAALGGGGTVTAAVAMGDEAEAPEGAEVAAPEGAEVAAPEGAEVAAPEGAEVPDVVAAGEAAGRVVREVAVCATRVSAASTGSAVTIFKLGFLNLSVSQRP
jgi:hypothetical protein